MGRANGLRLADWRQSSDPRLVPLVRDVGFGNGYDGALYAQSWALVRFAQRDHPSAFTAYLDRLRLPNPLEHESTPDLHLRLFRESFGNDLETLRSAWTRETSKWLTPLDENEPGTHPTSPTFSTHRD